MDRKYHKFRVILHPQDHGGYLVEVPDLPGCDTYGKTMKEALRNAEEAIVSYIGSLLLDGEEVPAGLSVEDEPSVPIVEAPCLQSAISAPEPDLTCA